MRTSPDLSDLCEILSRAKFFSGRELFEAMVQAACEVLGSDCALIATLASAGDADSKFMASEAIWFRGRLMGPMTYELADTPCADVMTAKACVFPRTVQELFPRDRLLVEMGMNSYAGSFLHDRRGQPIGVFALLSGDEIENPAAYGEVVVALAGLASGELERVAALRRLEEAQSKAEVANEAKARFLASLSHDVRTPLHGILSSTDLLACEDTTPERLELLKIIADSGSYLLNQFEEILDFTRLTQGVDRCERQVFQPESLLGELRRLVASSADAQGARLDSEVCGPMVRAWVAQDRPAILRVVTNLLDNAFKYGEGKPVTLTISATPAAANGGDDTPVRLCIAVEDSGPGIDEAERQKVFEPFTQLGGGHEVAELPGVGLGLAICTRLAQGLGGTLACVAPVRLSGSRFEFTFTCPQTKCPKVEAPGLPVAVSPLHVLLVEDSAVNQLVAQRMLTRLGCTFEVAGDGQQALEKVAAGEFDLILMDCQMPVMDGLESTRLMRSQGVETTILAITANTLPEDQQECSHAGMDGFLSKPLRLPALRDALAGVDDQGSRGA